MGWFRVETINPEIVFNIKTGIYGHNQKAIINNKIR